MKAIPFIFSLFILLTSIHSSVCAQTEEITLEEIVVTATRDAEEIRKIPANVTVITKEEIERSNARATVDLLRDEVGGVVRDYYGTGKTASVDMRGFGETAISNVLVLVDGRRDNEIDLSGTDWTQSPIGQIERIEIVRGSGSVLYGDNAVGGVINIITRKPEKPFSARLDGVLGSYDDYRVAGSAGGKWGRLSAILNGGYQATDGYRDNGFLRAKDVGGKLSYDLNDAIGLSFSGGFHRDDAGQPGGLTRALLEQDRRATLRPDDKTQTDDGYIVLGAKAGLWDWGRIEGDLSYRRREVKDDFPSFFFEDERKITTWGFTPRYILEKSLGKHSNKLTLGFDFYRSEAEADLVSLSIFQEITKKSAGVYLLDELSILENLIFSFGGREEWVTYEFFQDAPRFKDTTKDDKFAWNLGLDYLFDKKASAFVSAKRSFRFPATDELFQFYPTPQINTALKPQTGYHYEGGVRYAFTDQIEANLTLFWMELREEIFFNPSAPPFGANENYPKTRRQGIEIGAKVKPLPWLAAWGNYGYVRPHLRSGSFSGNDIPGVPRHKGSLGADVDLGKGFLFNAKVNFVGSQYFISDFANQGERLDPYETVDMKLSYTWKGLKAFAGINNLFNKKYSEWAVTYGGAAQVFYPAPERNFFGGISYTF